MTPEQLRDQLYGKWDVRDSTLRRRAIREAEDKAVEEACVKYRHSDNPFLQQMANRCNPHVPCPYPESCNADQVCIYRCQWFPDNVGNRSRLAIQAGAAKCLQDDYQRHTVDIRHPAPQYAENEMLAVERGVRWAKVAWVVLGVVVAGYVAWRWFSIH